MAPPALRGRPRRRSPGFATAVVAVGLLLGAFGAPAPLRAAGEQPGGKVWRTLTETDRREAGTRPAPPAPPPESRAPGTAPSLVLGLLIAAAVAVVAAVGITLGRRPDAARKTRQVEGPASYQDGEDDVEGLWRVHLRKGRRALRRPVRRGGPES